MEIRLLHLDDKDITRLGVRSLLADSVLHLVGSTASAEEAMRWAKERFPDILLLNIQAETFDGVHFLQNFRKTFPRQKVIILTSTNDPYYLLQAAKHGARDYVLDKIAGMDLVLLIQNTYYGTDFSLNETWTQALRMANSPQFRELQQKLTHREEQVLRFLVRGMSNKEIAHELEISAETIKEHLQHIFRKIGVHDRTEAAVWAVRKGLA
ncbi:MAG: response regulator transcription factor [Planctomycetaceae bacterium]|nr:response regulator transcription factor [Planctomycetaceae bacterium]MBQ2820753.1 response regulator transcription factor [Thermoguttaceae bacterium]